MPSKTDNALSMSSSIPKNNPDTGDKNSTKVGKPAPKKYEEIHFVDKRQAVWNYSLFSDEDVKNFQQGTHYSLYKFFGNTQLELLDTWGTYFSVGHPMQHLFL